MGNDPQIPISVILSFIFVLVIGYIALKSLHDQQNGKVTTLTKVGDQFYKAKMTSLTVSIIAGVVILLLVGALVIISNLFAFFHWFK